MKTTPHEQMSPWFFGPHVATSRNDPPYALCTAAGGALSRPPNPPRLAPESQSRQQLDLKMPKTDDSLFESPPEAFEAENVFSGRLQKQISGGPSA